MTNKGLYNKKENRRINPFSTDIAHLKWSLFQRGFTKEQVDERIKQLKNWQKEQKQLNLVSKKLNESLDVIKDMQKGGENGNN